jgi:hypothetical protein
MVTLHTSSGNDPFGSLCWSLRSVQANHEVPHKTILGDVLDAQEAPAKALMPARASMITAAPQPLVV